MSTASGTGRTWRTVALTLLAAGALAGFSIAGWFFARLTDVRTATAVEADRAIDGALASTGHRHPWVRLDTEGRVVVSPPDEAASPVKTLHVVYWAPARSLLTDTALPMWFVRLKTGDAINLGTLVAASAGDFGGLSLDITADDLARHGPGAVLDHRRPDGTRIVLWTE